MITFDVDIDVADRDKLLSLIPHRVATQTSKEGLRKHNSGIYVTEVPYDSLNGRASITYDQAEARGYFKIDILNVGVYQLIRDQEHYDRILAQEPDWTRLNDRKFVEQIIHINNWYTTMQQMPEPVNSIGRMAMFLSIIRPGKKHLIGKPWREVALTVWDKTEDGYSFKKSHSCSYAHLVALHMNLLADSADQSN